MSMHRGFRAILGVVAVAGFVLAGGGVARAQQADFTFNVKLDLKNLHEDVLSAGTECAVCTSKGCPSGSEVGKGFEMRPTNGAATFAESLSVAVNAEQGKSAADATAWQCLLYIGVPGATVRAIAPGGGGSAPALNAKDGTQFVGTLSGAIQ